MCDVMTAFAVRNKDAMQLRTLWYYSFRVEKLSRNNLSIKMKLNSTRGDICFSAQPSHFLQNARDPPHVTKHVC